MLSPLDQRLIFGANWGTSMYYFNWQFIYTFWVYIVAVIIYLGLDKTILHKIKEWKIFLVFGILFIFILIIDKQI